MNRRSSLELAGLPEYFPGQSRLEANEAISRLSSAVWLQTTSLEVFPLQHISALKSTFRPLRPIADCDQKSTSTLPSPGFLFTLLTVSSVQSLRGLIQSTSALEVFTSACRSLDKNRIFLSKDPFLSCYWGINRGYLLGSLNITVNSRGFILFQSLPSLPWLLTRLGRNGRSCVSALMDFVFRPEARFP
jgi:hypothetical protein